MNAPGNTGTAEVRQWFHRTQERVVAHLAWRPWLWRPMSSTVALTNARDASRELSRGRVEREEADIFVARMNRVAASRRRK